MDRKYKQIGKKLWGAGKVFVSVDEYIGAQLRDFAGDFKQDPDTVKNGFVFTIYNSDFVDAVGVWGIIILKNREARSSGLSIELKGEGYGKRLVFIVLRYLYKKFGVRIIETEISKAPGTTEDFIPTRNLLLTMGYRVVGVTKLRGYPNYILELSGENYKDLSRRNIPLKKDRAELEKDWQNQLKGLKKK